MEENSSTNLSVIPEFSKIKNVVLEQYYSAQIALTHYTHHPDSKNESVIRKCLFSLSHSLSLKSNVLDSSNEKEKEMKEYFQAFMSDPSQFQSFSINAIFSICHLIMERLGYFKVETEVVDKSNVYSEV